MSPIAVAKVVRTGVQRIYDWEAGLELPPRHALEDLARLYSVSLEELRVA